MIDVVTVLRGTAKWSWRKKWRLLAVALLLQLLWPVYWFYGLYNLDFFRRQYTPLNVLVLTEPADARIIGHWQPNKLYYYDIGHLEPDEKFVDECGVVNFKPRSPWRMLIRPMPRAYEIDAPHGSPIPYRLRVCSSMGSSSYHAHLRVVSDDDLALRLPPKSNHFNLSNRFSNSIRAQKSTRWVHLFSGHGAEFSDRQYRRRKWSEAFNLVNYNIFYPWYSNFLDVPQEPFELRDPRYLKLLVQVVQGRDVIGTHDLTFAPEAAGYEIYNFN